MTDYERDQGTTLINQLRELREEIEDRLCVAPTDAAKIMEAWSACFGEPTEDGIDAIEDAYQGSAWLSEREFAEDFVDSTGLINGENELLVRYFDYESFARDLFIDDFVFHNGIVFSRHW